MNTDGSKKNRNMDRRNLIYFSVGMFISIFGTMIYTFAVGLYVLKLTGSGMNFALTLLFSVVATIIFNPIAGVVADRFSKKHLIVLMDVCNGLLFIGIFVVTKWLPFSLWLIYCSAFITTGLTTVFSIAFDCGKPEIVSEEHLLKINSVDKIINSVASIGGPAIGGIIFAVVDIRLFIVFNGVSFIISALLESRICFYKSGHGARLGTISDKNLDAIEKDLDYDDKITAYNNATGKEKDNFSFKEDIKIGVKYIVSKKELLSVLWLMVALNFFISLSMTVPLPFILNQVLGLEPSVYGVTESLFAVGMIVGALTIKWIIERVSYRVLIKMASVALAVLMVGISLPLVFKGCIGSSLGYMMFYSIIMFCIGVAIAFVDIPIMYYLQKEVPKSVRGRVISLGIAGVKVIAPVGLVLSGVFLNRVGAYVLPLVGGILLLVGTMLLFKSKETTGKIVMDKA